MAEHLINCHSSNFKIIITERILFTHYTFGSIEVIDVIEGLKLPYHLGNAVKYIARAGHKDPAKTTEDLRKAVWYLNRYISLLEKEDAK